MNKQINIAANGVDPNTNQLTEAQRNHIRPILILESAFHLSATYHAIGNERTVISPVIPIIYPVVFGEKCIATKIGVYMSIICVAKVATLCKDDSARIDFCASHIPVKALLSCLSIGNDEIKCNQ